MRYFTYLYEDPKTLVLRYVGKGDELRPLMHFRKSSNPQLTNMLMKRKQEGFSLAPILIEAPSEASSFAMEIFWIAVIGREDLGRGTLFNKTGGGEGVGGRIISKEVRDQWAALRKAEWAARTTEELEVITECHREIYHSKTDKQKVAIAKKISDSTSATYQAKPEKVKAEIRKKKSTAKLEYHQSLSEEAKAIRSRNISAGMARRKAELQNENPS